MRAKAAKIALGLFLLLSGACMALDYIELRLVQPVDLITETRSYLGFAWWTTLLAFTFVQQKSPAPQSDISPALSGVIVILLTGGAAALAAGWGYTAAGDLLLPGLILLATAIVAACVWRFARRNATLIGEAQFRTTPKD